MTQLSRLGSHSLRFRHILIVLLLLGIVFAPVLIINGQGSVTVKAAVQAKLRNGPGTNYAFLADVPEGAVMPAVGRNADSTWIQVNFNNTIGWVAVRLLTITGNVNTLPVSTGQGGSPANPVNPQNPPSASNTGNPAAPTPRPTPGPRGAISMICKTHVPNSLVTAYTTNPGIHPAVILREAGGFHEFNYTRPFAGLVSALPQLAFCLSDPIMVELDARWYVEKETDRRFLIKRLQQKIVVRVLIIQNGQTIATGDFLGASPMDYKEHLTSEDLNEDLNIQGPAVTPEQVADWVRGFVKR